VIYGGTLRHSGNQMQGSYITRPYLGARRQRREGCAGGGAHGEGEPCRARSKEWRTSQITRLLCDTQPSLENLFPLFPFLSLPPSLSHPSLSLSLSLSPGIKKIYLLTKRFPLNVRARARATNCSKNWIFRGRAKFRSIAPMTDSPEEASLILVRRKSSFGASL